MPEIARATRAATAAPQPATAPDLLLDGLAAAATGGHAAAAPLLRQALTAFRDQDDLAEDELGWLLLACRTAGATWNDEAWHTLSAG